MAEGGEATPAEFGNSVQQTGIHRTATFDGAAEGDLNTPLILVPEGWQPYPDTKLNDCLVIGKLLGEGFMGQVYNLVKTDGSPTKRVLKVLRPTAKDADRDNLERELVIGRVLAEAMGAHDAEGSPTIPGYMMTQAAIREVDVEGTLLGIISEKINGQNVFSRLDSFGFHTPVSIHYVRSMLAQTLQALKKGQQTVGFYHRDMHAGNVMEHMPPHTGYTVKEAVQCGSTSLEKTLSIRAAKEDLVELSSQGWRYRTEAASDVWRDVEGTGRSDLGIEFKVIDYGWAVVTAVDDERVSDLMTKAADEGIPGAVGIGNHCSAILGFLLGGWLCKCTTGSESAQVHEEAGMPATPSTLMKSASKHQADKTKPSTEKLKVKGSKIPQLGMSSMLYHHVWKGSSDCWRLLSSLAAILDGRLWHSRDIEAVLHLEDLLYKASGVHMRLYFTNKDDSKKYKHKAHKYGVAWQARQLMRKGHRGYDMGWSMVFPSDPGFTIEAALDHPFFHRQEYPESATVSTVSPISPKNHPNTLPLVSENGEQ